MKKINIQEILLGLVSGLISGMFASGGGLILIPAYIFLFNSSDKEAKATSIFCVLPMVLVSIFLYGLSILNNSMNWKITFFCIIGSIIRSIYWFQTFKYFKFQVFKNIFYFIFNILWNTNNFLLVGN